MTRRKVRSVRRFPGNMVGAASDDLVQGQILAEEVFGEASRDPNSGLIAFTYLTIRFGAPRYHRHDDSLGEWILSTQDPEVFLTLSPSGNAIRLSVGYLMTQTLRDAANAPQFAWSEAVLAHYLAKYPDEDPNAPGFEEAYIQWHLDPEFEEALTALGAVPSHGPHLRWREGSALRIRVCEALLGTLCSLRRPIRVRDLAFNLVGRVPRDDGSEFAPLRQAFAALAVRSEP